VRLASKVQMRGFVKTRPLSANCPRPLAGESLSRAQRGSGALTPGEGSLPLFSRHRTGGAATFHIVTLLLVLVLAGCGGASHPIQYYTLDLPAAPDASRSPYPVTLLVARVAAPMILRDDRIVYRSGANELGTYEYHRWAEPPAMLLETSLLRLLRSSGSYQSVSEMSSRARGQYLVRGRLYDFEEVDSSAITARVALEADLVDEKSGKVVWSHFYSHDEPASEDDVASVVAALNKNLMRGLDEVATGLDEYFSKNPPKP